MALTVVYSSQALRDLSSIREYLVARSPSGAARVRDRILSRIGALTDFPESGAPTPDPDIRISQLTRYPYRIYYAVEKDELVVLHIRHTARAPVELGKLKR